ncbi:MAG: glyoxalase [Nocardioidaceae bacterium]|nr:glyoxalase [Nocardioidaceae bacterium]
MTRDDRNIWTGVTYADPLAGRAWLAALGFEEGICVPGATAGSVMHSEMLWPEGGRVMVVSGTNDLHTGERPGSSFCYVVTADPDAVHAKAEALGATVTRPLEDTDYGSRGFSLSDPEGNGWSFGTYAGED